MKLNNEREAARHQRVMWLLMFDRDYALSQVESYNQTIDEMQLELNDFLDRNPDIKKRLEKGD